MKSIIVASCLFLALPLAAEEALEVDTTRIKANKELPKVLYVIPWKDMETNKSSDQKIVLHDFFGDLYEPTLVSNAAQPNETVLVGQKQ